MWNRLATPSIDDREGMEGGGEGTSSKEVNGGREWLSMVSITVYERLVVSFRLCFMARSVKK